MKLLLLTVLIALTHLHVYGQDDYCFGKDTERAQTRHFSAKTAYQIVKGVNIEKQYLVPGCEPKKIWILHRHGTRLPDKKTIEKAPKLEQLRDEIVKNYRVRKTKPLTNALCQEDLIALQMWKWNNSITVDQYKYLTSQGYDDLRGTAKLYQKYYPNILTREYNQTHYLFRHTDKQRTTESFKAFAEGLFGANNRAEAVPIPERDDLLRPYDYCPSHDTLNTKEDGSEFFKYTHLQLWNNTAKDISRRLGFLYDLDESDIELMYKICRYEQAWQVDRTSVWCAAFTPDQVSVFEYAEDLSYYYQNGYGYEETSRIACSPVQDMLTRLESDQEPNAVIYFAHSATLQTFITALGINKDDIKLLANNYNELTNRRWKTSLLDPFAANFVAVKYDCNSDPINKEKVIFFLNQNAVNLDWCNVGLCNWADVMKHYETFYKADCEKYFCGDGAASISMSLVTALLAAIVYLIY